MLFNSWLFALFFCANYTLYLLAGRRSHRLQNGLLLVASYVFYGAWDARFLTLIWVSTLVDFAVGRALGRQTAPARRKRLLAVSLIANLGILGSFKYLGFFVESMADLLSKLGIDVGTSTLSLVLPVGISFYTFQTISYSVDVYRGRLEPTRDLLGFALFVAFFPQLVAGPIERAQRLLPQIAAPRRVSAQQLDAGVFLILWGLFKKVVVADNAAAIANQIFNNHHQYSGLELVVGVLAFTLQIYGDFSGYSDMARGLAKLLGFELVINFKLPYLAKNPSEFWRRWHVSLSEWLRDYLYIPLGGNRRGRLLTLRNLVITMALGGLWHGAAWNFVLWGLYHGALLVIYAQLSRGLPGLRLPPSLRSPWRVIQGLVMFGLTVAGWLLFRATSWEQIAYFAGNIGLAGSRQAAEMAFDLVYFALPVAVMHAVQYAKDDLLAALRLPLLVRAGFYALLICWMLVFGVRESIEFIYFQF